MSTAQLRSKDEIARDIEHNRHKMGSALRDTRTNVVTRNPATLAWKSSQAAYFRAKDAVVTKATIADCKVRDNIYSGIGIALGVGAVTGFLLGWKRSRSKARKAKLSQ